MKCGMDNECVYDGKDEVRSVYEDKLKKAGYLISGPLLYEPNLMDL